jgi:hypothetical protein
MLGSVSYLSSVISIYFRARLDFTLPGWQDSTSLLGASEPHFRSGPHKGTVEDLGCSQVRPSLRGMGRVSYPCG